MAQHPTLTAFLAQVDADVGAGTSTEFLTSTGRRLVAAHILAEKDFPKTGQPGSAELGGLLRTLHSLGPAVDWAGTVTAGHGSRINFLACRCGVLARGVLCEAHATNTPAAPHFVQGAGACTWRAWRVGCRWCV